MSTHYEFLGLELESPLVNAAGSINGTNPEAILREVETLASTGIGAITVGSFTVPPQEGNAAKFGEPVYYHDRSSGKTYNSMGLPNIGLQAVKKLAPEIIARAAGKPVIFSGSPTNSPENGTSVEQAVRLASELLQLGDNTTLVEINVSCPNVVTDQGERKPIMGYDLGTMAHLIDALNYEVGEELSVGLKLPPYISEEDLVVADGLKDLFLSRSVVQFLVTSNTIPNQIPRNDKGEPILSVHDGKGGMSGPATREAGRYQLGLWKELMGDHIEIISTLGVNSGDELAARLKLGAAAAGGVTFLWESDNWKNAVTRVLTDFAYFE